ncbi:translation initiation factor IF-5A [Candidatus Woesearchaeota archaeon]|nr:MAG: translation initiation factor IF-5A [Candidatus Woesearchaeota archaeon]
MAVKVAEPGSIKVGGYIIMDGEACRVIDVSTSRPGKHGHAKFRIVAVGLIDGKKRDMVLPGHDKVEVPIIEKKTAQVLSVTGDTANVMDTETYETFDLKIPEELQGKITEGTEVLYWIILDEKVMKQVKGA